MDGTKAECWKEERIAAKKMNRKGFSIIEILLTTVLVGIVALAVTYFLTTGIKTCNHAESQINLQTEAQVIMNQLTTFSFEGNDAQFFDFGNDNYAYVLYHTNKNTKQATLENIVLFRKAENKMYYYEITGDPSEDLTAVKEELTNPAASISIGELMCDYVTDFKVECTKKPVITFTVSLALEEKTYSSSETVRFRSKEADTEYTFITLP